MLNLSAIRQPREGYRYNLDSLLLLRFARFRDGERLCDLGAGVGVLGLLALQLANLAQVTAVELQEELSRYALENAEALQLGKRFRILHRDWRELPKILPARGFEVVLSNPPYRSPESGRRPPQRSKDLARFESPGGLESLLDAVDHLLADRGRLYLLYPPLRLEKLIVELKRRDMKLSRLACIHSFADSSAHLVMIEASRSPRRELKVEAPLIVYRDAEHYMPEVQSWVGPKRRD